MLPADLQILVDTFHEQIESYRNSAYNETQLRREFLDKVIKILGWDVDNEAGRHESFKEVIHEDRLKIGGTTKAPDYCVQIGGRKLFYIEAKKPSVNINEDTGPAFQVRRYGWTSGMPVCLLTDFEEFAVYDTSVKPKVTDKPGIARIFYCRYDELDKPNPLYPDCENNWDYLFCLFSKNSVEKGSLEKIKNRDKKGTQPVDQEFLKEIEEWRKDLAADLAKSNTLSERELNYAVQKTIDRIIFFRICEDRGIESENTLKKIADNADVYAALLRLFEEADDKYNSGIFHFRQEKENADAPDLLTPGLKIGDKTLKTIIKSLYDPAPYVFSVMPADILGSIYERFLGNVIRMTSEHRVKIEPKPEVKKAGGVYYTPQYIVDYIVGHTVGAHLQDKIPAAIKKFHVVDPACGSGSFLINAYQHLLDWYFTEYLKEPEKYKKQLVKTGVTDWKLSIQERKRILIDHIFGVDIDTQAVEVTKLSLLLKALEGLNSQEIQKELFHERV
ncbi:MAG: N-6 DNA methylase, partial [Spirochaetales bacterium]|nr:N-6 DNA methylase [Spirochaetales bacterium]